MVETGVVIPSDEIGRIDVELLATGDDPSSPAPVPAAPNRDGPVVPGDRRSRRPRVTVTAVVVASLLAAGIGWSVAGAIRDDRASPSDPGAGAGGAAVADDGRDRAAVDVDADTRARSAPSGAEPSGSPLVPIARVTPVLGDAEPIVVEMVGVPAVLAAQEVEIVAYGNGRLLTRLDLSTGLLRTQFVQRHAFGRARVLLGSDWVLLPSPDEELPSVVVAADGTVDLVDLGADRTVLGVTAVDQVWLAHPEVVAAGGVVEAVDVAGDVMGTIDLPGPPLQFDPRGGIVVRTDEGTTAVGAKASAIITTGDLLALGPAVAVARECADPTECGVVVVDRDTGERRTVTPFRSDSVPPVLDGIRADGVAPDGRHAIVTVHEPGGGRSAQVTIGTLDLVTGEVVEIGPVQHADSATWSPDGRFVFFNGGGRIRAHDTDSGRGFAVSDRLLAVESFAVRPALPDEGFPTP